MDCNYYTCQQLLDRYVSVKSYGWNVSKLGVFYNCLLVDGRGFGRKKRVAIDEESFRKLIVFAEHVRTTEEQDQEYLSFEEVIEIYPQADKYRWTPTVMGIFLKSSLLKGKKSWKESRNLVTKQSAFRLIQYTGQRFADIASWPPKY